MLLFTVSRQGVLRTEAGVAGEGAFIALNYAPTTDRNTDSGPDMSDICLTLVQRVSKTPGLEFSPTSFALEGQSSQSVLHAKDRSIALPLAGAALNQWLPINLVHFPRFQTPRRMAVSPLFQSTLGYCQELVHRWLTRGNSGMRTE